jgi:hypothetical protein
MIPDLSVLRVVVVVLIVLIGTVVMNHASKVRA